MLVQATTPRPFFDHSKHPEHVYIYTLRKPGISEGAVFFNASTNPEQGRRGTAALEPLFEHPIDGEDGFAALEYVLPFFELFRPEDKKRNLGMAPFCTTGFGVTVRSAFRTDTSRYGEHTVAFTILMPVTGGGVMRLSDCLFDIANPTFDPWAPGPERKWKNLEVGMAFNRAHRLGDTSAIEQRRMARIREAEANMRANESGGRRALPPKR